MASSGREETLRPSIIDRLGTPTGEGGESRFIHGIGVRELRASVARDLAWLLNTRISLPDTDLDVEGLEEARVSNLSYGLPDISNFSWANPQDVRDIAALVERAIRTFEPRLVPRTVKVEIVPTQEVSDFSVRLRIEAVLRVEPIHELVTFDSSADFDGGSIRVESFE